MSVPFRIVSDDTASAQWDSADGVVVALEGARLAGGLEAALSFLPADRRKLILDYALRFISKASPAVRASFDVSPRQRVVLQGLPRGSAFRRLELARRSLAPLFGAKARSILVDLRGVEAVAEAADAFVSAFTAGTYEGPRYRKAEEKKDKKGAELLLLVPAASAAAVAEAAARAHRLTEGTNLVRRLATMAGNDLTTSRYVDLATRLAKEAGLKTEFFSFDKLKGMGAGAFCAVAQGSKDRGAGILKIRYEPRGAVARVALVGKGITYDTGGAQLKPGEHMFGMHGDMAGSAVALALIRYLAASNVPWAVTAYLAIADNQLSPESYRPNDVVTSLKGKTIEVVDTDAEGRMVMADTLTLACQDPAGKPDLIVDFATLTGSCVRAIGNHYSGGYSNRKRLLPLIRKAGVRSGERVWPFPNDPDYGRCLKSAVADIKQCRVRGGVDHIEASYFLRQFVDRSVPYVHVDLSAMENEGGLAHVPTDGTGFGVRFGAELISLALARS